MQPGENLLGAGVAPIRLSNASKLVYSPHVYGPSRFAAKDEPAHYADAGFPASCRDVWQRHFGYAREATGRPVVVGEVGGTFKGRDKEFQQEFVAWAAEEPAPPPPRLTAPMSVAWLLEPIAVAYCAVASDCCPNAEAWLAVASADWPIAEAKLDEAIEKAPTAVARCEEADASIPSDTE